ncbi:hypothetical protein [Natronococcus sp.]
MTAAAVVFFTIPAPTDGPQVIPVEEPPMLKPTKAEAITPISRRVSTIIG